MRFRIRALTPNVRRTFSRAACGCCGGIGLAMMVVPSALHRQGVLSEMEEKVIRYSDSSDLSDPVALLQGAIAKGQVKLKYDSKLGYLASLLKELRIPISSQALVFSKTSSQNNFIGPKTPRALYFSDKAYIGFALGASVIDIEAVDPKKGTIFYTLEQNAGVPPKFQRREDCMSCHLGPKTLNVPGPFVRSVFAMPDGRPISEIQGFPSSHSPPIKERWGGWYVTGTHENDEHLGNSVVMDSKRPAGLDTKAGANVTDLSARFDTKRYLSPHSDIVSLLILEHQLRMQNLITQANYECRYAIAEWNYKNPSEGATQSAFRTKWIEKRFENAAEALLAYMLMRDEAEIKGKIKGTSGFEEEFQRAGPKDSRGRSLRQLDLRTRLFRYPCSYMIYSDAFNALPLEMKSYLWRRLNEVLGGSDGSQAYASMAPEDHKAVLEILLATKPDFRDFSK